MPLLGGFFVSESGVAEGSGSSEYGEAIYGGDVYGEVAIPDVTPPDFELPPVTDATPFVLEPLALFVEVTKPSGRTYRFDEGGVASQIPRNIQFNSSRNTGFATASFNLPRRLDLEYVDIGLLDEVRIASASGHTVWEGFVTDLPRELGDDGHSISVQAVGFMAHMQDRKVPLLYIDRDLSHFAEPPSTRQLANYGTTFGLTGNTQVTSDWLSEDSPLLMQQIDKVTTVYRSRAEGFYTAAQLPIGSLYYELTSYDLSAAGGPLSGLWDVRAVLSDEDVHTGGTYDTTADLGGSATGTLTATTGTRKFASLHFFYDSLAGAVEGVWQARWNKLAVRGTHGLTLRGTGAGGYYASDILRHLVSSYAPLLDTSNVIDTSWLVEHFVELDPISPYDAMLKLNAFHLFEMGVWEDRQLHWAPLDLTDWDWEIRQDDPVTISLQGDSAEELVNGVTVHYQDLLTAAQKTLYPSDDARLRDDSEGNPYTSHGRTHDLEITLSFPVTEDSAIEIGRIALAEALQAKRPGSITVNGGYVRDRQGNMQPAWRVRSGDRVRITDIPSDLTRPIGEAAWDHESKRLTINVDSTVKRLEAFFDRTAVALAAANLAR